MSNIVSIAYCTEGTTDRRFLEHVIKNTFDEVAFTCSGAIDVYDPVYISSPRLGSFEENIKSIASLAHKGGLNILCVHCDADAETDENVFKNKLTPTFGTIEKIGDGMCTNLVAIVPVRMTEAWMLADIDLLKEEMCTVKSNVDLGLTRVPETIADPKSVIMEALRISQIHLPNRRNHTTIGELYQPIGQNLSITKLEALASYKSFKNSVENAFKKMNYLH
jgi:hypothetical protein